MNNFVFDLNYKKKFCTHLVNWSNFVYKEKAEILLIFFEKITIDVCIKIVDCTLSNNYQYSSEPFPLLPSNVQVS